MAFRSREAGGCCASEQSDGTRTTQAGGASPGNKWAALSKELEILENPEKEAAGGRIPAAEVPRASSARRAQPGDGGLLADDGQDTGITFWSCCLGRGGAQAAGLKHQVARAFECLAPQQPEERKTSR